MVVMFVGADGLNLGQEMHRYPLRLGADVFATGELGHASIVALKSVFATLANVMQQARVRHYRAVATAALREARNGTVVLEQLERATGIRLEIISGQEEGELSRQALGRAIGMAQGDATPLFVDLGGGSLELGLPADNAARSRVLSLPFGTVRLLEEIPQIKHTIAVSEFDEILDSLVGRMRLAVGDASQSTTAVGTGGNLRFLAAVGGELSNHAIPRIELSQLEALARSLAGMNVASRMIRYHLRADRADVVVPAALVILALTRVFQLGAFLVPEAGLRDAILYDLHRSLSSAVSV